MEIRTNVTIEEEIVEWIDQQVKEKKFQNKSNAVEHYLRIAYNKSLLPRAYQDLKNRKDTTS